MHSLIQQILHWYVAEVRFWEMYVLNALLYHHSCPDRPQFQSEHSVTEHSVNKYFSHSLDKKGCNHISCYERLEHLNFKTKAEKQPLSTMLPPPCFTISMVLFWWCAVLFLSQTYLLELWSKSSTHMLLGDLIYLFIHA